MKYKDLLEFCNLILETEADDSVIGERHVMPNGYIVNVWYRVLVAMQKEEDFDFRTYLEKLIDHSQLDVAKKRILN